MKPIGKADPYYPGRIQSDSIAVIVLVANAEQHFNIPTAATVAVFSCTANFYVLVNGQTAAVPAVTATSGANTIPELNPTVLAVTAGNLLSIVSPSNCNATISFYTDTDLV